MTPVSTNGVPEYIAVRITQPPPTGARVVAGSTPVVAFGDVRKARIATLGWNPSKFEFLDPNGRLLEGDERRLETRKSLKVNGPSTVDDFVASVFGGCNTYFQRQPYRRWFDVLEKVLKQLSASYYDGSACHLDLVQWATDPVWRGLGDPERESLLSSDVPFLRQQLSQENVRLLLLNGAGIIRAYEVQFGVNLEPLAFPNGNRVKIFCGRPTPKLLVIGWNLNLQSSFGVSNGEITMIGAQVGKIIKQTADHYR